VLVFVATVSRTSMMSLVAVCAQLGRRAPIWPA
jgi:hypothetical protein